MIRDKRHTERKWSIVCTSALKKIRELNAFACVYSHNSPLSNSQKIATEKQRKRKKK